MFMYNYRKKIFLFLSALLWLCFLLCDLFTSVDSTWVKYTSICLCCLTALLGATTTDGRLVAAALCFTVAADWFLLVRNDHYEWGIGLFIIVQIFYALRLFYLRGKKIRIWELVLRCVSFLLFFLLFLLAGYFLIFKLGALFKSDWVHEKGDLLSPLLFFLVSVSLPYVIPVWIYFSNLCINAAGAFALKKHLFAIGLVLFILCDLCAGAYNLALYFDYTLNFAQVGMWFFYLPSQVLIVLSQETEKGVLHETAI